MEQFNALQLNASACSVSGTGIYADVDWNDETNKHKVYYHDLLSEYARIKNDFVENIEFDPYRLGYCKY